MLDMAEYLKKYVVGDALEDQIWRDRGGSSVDFLEKILITQLFTTFVVCNPTDDFEVHLKTLGPAVISSFKV